MKRVAETPKCTSTHATKSFRDQRPRLPTGNGVNKIKSVFFDHVFFLRRHEYATHRRFDLKTQSPYRVCGNPYSGAPTIANTVLFSSSAFSKRDSGARVRSEWFLRIRNWFQNAVCSGIGMNARSGPHSASA
jgi:hypothetical protein